MEFEELIMIGVVIGLLVLSGVGGMYYSDKRCDALKRNMTGIENIDGDVNLCRINGMKYHRTVSGYAVCYTESPINFKYVKAVE